MCFFQRLNKRMLCTRVCNYLLIIFIAIQCSVLHANCSKPIAIYLTWQHAPTTTMTVQWISDSETQKDQIEYQKDGTSEWKSIEGGQLKLSEGSPYVVHRVEMTGLTPNTEYRFRINKEEQTYKFLTLQEDLKTPIRFVVGGDIYQDSIESVTETNIQAAKSNPHFALLGGDIAYAAFKDPLLPEDINRWLIWLKTWQQTMVTPDGRMIPMVTAIGNHDTRGRYGQPPEQATCYYNLFSTPGNLSYRIIDFGNYLSIVILDSGHTQSISGEQAQWLDATLKDRKDKLHKFALYHVGAYPSVRQMDNKIAPLIREHWVPIFEKYSLHAGFEHHDHAYKRTQRIKNNKVDPKGVLYLGDGAWGVADPRLPRVEGELWFLAKTAPERHFILVTLDGSSRTFTAINSKGEKFDNYEMKD